ncbi:subtilisin-like protein [Cadophora sp. DSE1049]|nr:subtilisin-like protein [Cadophora sp. DSE1049]
MGALDKYVDGSKREEALKWKERCKRAIRLSDDGKFEEALVLCQQNLDWSLENLGTDHNCTVSDQEALAQAFYSLKRFKEARKLDQAALDTRIRIEGVDPPSKELLEVKLNLAQDHVALKNFKSAAKLYESVYKSYEDVDIQVLKIAYDLAACWHHSRLYKKSKELNEWVLEKRIELHASDEQVALSKEAIKQNSKKIESVKKERAAERQKAAEEAEKKAKEAERREARKVEQERKAAQKSEAEARRVVDTRSTEGRVTMEKGSDQKQSKEEIEAKRLEEVEARALERERLAREVRVKERAERAAADEKARIEKTQARREQARKDAMAQFGSSQPQQGSPKWKNEEPSSPIPIPSINVQKPDQRPSSAPKHNSGFSKNYEEWKDGLETNTKKPRPRSNSQENRNPTDRIPYRHISRVDLLSQFGSSQAGSTSGSEVGESDKPSRLPPEGQPWVGTMPQRKPKPVSNDTKKESSPQRNSPSPSLKPDIAAKSNLDLSRSQSLNSRKDKGSVPDQPRSGTDQPRSVSANPGKKRGTSLDRNRNKAEQYYSQLFDAKGGKDDDDSTFAVNSWFHSLDSETQKLLIPLRRSQGKRVKIAILDTGIDLSHPDFKEDQSASRMNRRIKTPEDFLDPGEKAFDTCGHGTYCVGLLRRVAPEADIYVARVAKDFKGVLDENVVAKAIHRACGIGKDDEGKRNWNVDIITMSFGFYNNSTPVRLAIKEAIGNSVLLFAAASNNGIQRDMTFPAKLPGVFCINSTTGLGRPSEFNPPLRTDNTFSIIGENVQSSWITHQNGHPQRSMSGTSVATPIAAAVAALVLEYVLQNDPESKLLEHLDELKEYYGMSKIFYLMSNNKNTFGYDNIVPWEVLTTRKGDRSDITRRMKDVLEIFGGQ